MSVGANSRYLLTDVIQVLDPLSGQLARPEFQDLRSRVSEFATDDRFITVDATMTWANLGLNVLGDARHYWVIADLSGVIDPFTELPVGGMLRSPSIQRFLFQILSPNLLPQQVSG